MQLDQIKTITLQTLQEAKGKFLLPYQIFDRIKRADPRLGQQIEDTHSTETDRPNMGEGAGTYYSPASYVAHALNRFKDSYPEIEKEWFDTNGIEVDGIIPGNKEGTSIWAWKEKS